MKKSDQLKQQRAAKIEAQGKLLEAREKKEDRSFTEDEEAKFIALDDEIKELDGKIEMEERAEAAQKRAASLAAHGAGIPGEKGEKREKEKVRKRASIMKALRAASSRHTELEGAEKEMDDIAREENRAAGVDTPENALVNIPLSFLRAEAQTVSEDGGEYGGELVHDQAPRVQVPFAPGDVLSPLGVQRLTGLRGGDVPLPVGGNYDFQWLAETAEITVQKQTFLGPKVSPKRVGAAVQLSNRLLIQSSIDVDNWIRMELLKGYNRAINAAAINGSGTPPEPEGILNNADVQTSEVVAPAEPTKEMITELVALVETANATDNSLAYMLNPVLSALLQNTKIDQGSGRFIMEAKDTLNGTRAVVTTHVPDLAGNHVLIYGDWSQLFVGEWGALSVLSDPYTKSTSNSVQLVVNAHADVAIAQPTAFAVNKFITDPA